jgi:hypothetical protein
MASKGRLDVEFDKVSSDSIFLFIGRRVKTRALLDDDLTDKCATGLFSILLPTSLIDDDDDDDDDGDGDASADTRQTKQPRTADSVPLEPGDDAAEEEEEQENDEEEDEEAATPLKLHNNDARKQNKSWRGARSNRQSPSASADEERVAFLPPFRRGIRFLEISNHPAFFGRTDGIVGGWAVPPSERLARFKSNSMKSNDKHSRIQTLNVSLPDMVNIVHDVLRFCCPKSEIRNDDFDLYD